MFGSRRATLACALVGGLALLTACGNSSPESGNASTTSISGIPVGNTSGSGGAGTTSTVIPSVSMPLSHSGRWITDASGRIVIYHGINVASKLDPYTPQFQGFTKEHAAMLAREGFSNVRVWIFWKAFEPAPGVWDDSSLAAIKEFVGWLHDYGITTTLNFSQLLWGEEFGGLGFPDWAAQTDGLPNIAPAANGAAGMINPAGNLVVTGLTNPAPHRAFDHFYANDKVTSTTDGVQDQFADAWKHVATYFKDVPGIVAYDLVNEPEAGSQDPTCFSPAGCPAFDQALLTPFNERIIAAIREVDTVHTIYYEPQVYAAAGFATTVGGGSDPNLVFSFHLYPALNDSGIDQTAKEAIQAFDVNQMLHGDAMLMGEFGAVDNLDQIRGIIDAADNDRLGWLYWAWYSTEPTGNPATPTTQVDHPEEGIVLNPKLPPTEDNLKADKLALLGRPYPFLIAGTPTAWHFDTASKTFTLSYTTMPIKGGAITAPTVIIVPQRLYPNGSYRVAVTGAKVTSAAGATAVTLEALPGATSVSLTLSPQ